MKSAKNRARNLAAQHMLEDLSNSLYVFSNDISRTLTGKTTGQLNRQARDKTRIAKICLHTF